MTDHATPNLPSRDFETTARFYAALGFEADFRDGGWMILSRGGVTLEFFPHPDLDPLTSSFGACLRLDDVDAFYEICRAAGVPERRSGHPRLHRPEPSVPGLRIGGLIDPDGSLLRYIGVVETATD